MKLLEHNKIVTLGKGLLPFEIVDYTVMNFFEMKLLGNHVSVN